jgi:hypothetical protein
VDSSFSKAAWNVRSIGNKESELVEKIKTKGIYVRSTKGNHIPAVNIQLQMISGRHFGLTYKSM